MNRARHQFFAGAGLAVNQNIGVAVGEIVHLIEYSLNRRALSENGSGRKIFFDCLTQRQIFEAQFFLRFTQRLVQLKILQGFRGVTRCRVQQLAIGVAIRLPREARP
jgi:hypothetical protein